MYGMRVFVFYGKETAAYELCSHGSGKEIL